MFESEFETKQHPREKTPSNVNIISNADLSLCWNCKLQGEVYHLNYKEEEEY